MTDEIFLLFQIGCWSLLPAIAGAILLMFIKNNGISWLMRISLWVSGACLLGAFLWLWYTLGRPPIKSIGEAKFIQALWLILLIIPVEFAWRHRGMPVVIFFVTAMALGVYLRPVLIGSPMLDRTRPPALQSYWFAPHVIVYMLSYAILTISFVIALIGLIKKRINENSDWKEDIDGAETMARLGFPFLTAGLIMGTFWAKSAWGSYWFWDPKETWAFITWGSYLTFFHLVHIPTWNRMKTAACLVIGFPIIMMAFFGVNHLPTAMASVHAFVTSDQGDEADAVDTVEAKENK